MLEDLVGDPKTYVEFCKDYYEESIDLETVKAIYDHATLTESIVKSLNEDIDYPALQAEMVKMKYPYQL